MAEGQMEVTKGEEAALLVPKTDKGALLTTRAMCCCRLGGIPQAAPPRGTYS